MARAGRRPPGAPHEARRPPTPRTSSSHPPLGTDATKRARLDALAPRNRCDDESGKAPSHGVAVGSAGGFRGPSFRGEGDVHDLVIRNGTVVDGRGGTPVLADV